MVRGEIRKRLEEIQEEFMNLKTLAEKQGLLNQELKKVFSLWNAKRLGILYKACEPHPNRKLNTSGTLDCCQDCGLSWPTSGPLRPTSIA